MSKPKIFIGSSSEGKDFANRLQIAIKAWSNPDVWSDTFDLSKTTIENLENNLPQYDMCIFLWTADDTSSIRGKEMRTARDNLIFETGLSIGSIGRKNTIIVMEETAKIISDLLGLTVIYHDFSQSISIVAQQIKDYYEKIMKIKKAENENIKAFLTLNSSICKNITNMWEFISESKRKSMSLSNCRPSTIPFRVASVKQ